MAHEVRLDPALVQVHEEAWVAPGAVIVGDVHVGPGASVWFGAVVRGDMAPIRIGARSNVQDGTIVHVDDDVPCTIGDDVTIGHRCIIHGATIEDGSLIGMGAIVMNNARIGARCLIGAGTLVAEGKIIPPRSLVLGVPGRVVRELRDDELAELVRSSEHYVSSSREYSRKYVVP